MYDNQDDNVSLSSMPPFCRDHYVISMHVELEDLCRRTLRITRTSELQSARERVGMGRVRRHEHVT